MAEDKKVHVFACTEHDMALGGGPLPTHPKAIEVQDRMTKPIKGELRALRNAYEALRKQGWREVMYAPKDGSMLALILPDCAVVVEGNRDKHGFMMFDGDGWPCDPVLWRPLEEVDPEYKGTPGE